MYRRGWGVGLCWIEIGFTRNAKFREKIHEIVIGVEIPKPKFDKKKVFNRHIIF
jgi:hypothetical protein